MARHGIPSWRIEMSGRWRSNMWRNTYINTDWRDMAKIKNCTVSELLEQIKNKPYKYLYRHIHGENLGSNYTFRGD